MNSGGIITLDRNYLPKATVSVARLKSPLFPNAFSFFTLELPWRNNERRISCIPEGRYKWKRHNSPKFGPSLWLPSVPGRSGILVHAGNFTADTLGCILPGNGVKDIDADGIPDVTNSRATLKKILSRCGEYGTIIIRL